MKKRTVFLGAFSKIEIYEVLGVADIQIIAPVGAFLCPYPDIGNILVTGIAVEPALNVPFQIQAVRACGYRVVPTGGSVRR